MHYFKVALGVIFGVVVFLFLDYALPSKQTVRVTNSYNRLTDIGANAMFFASEGTGTVENSKGQRDVRFLDTVRPNGRPYVYRNEDTGWVWPPYFKYDSSNLQAEANDVQSTADNPKWVSVTSYGWRIAWLSIYPNAISIKRVEGPTDRPFNWPAVILLVILGGLLLLIWRMWNQFRERMLDPAVERVDDAFDRAGDRATQARGRMGRWIDNLLGRKPR